MSEGFQCDRCDEFVTGHARRSGTMYPTDFNEPEHRRISFGHRTGDDNSGSRNGTVDLCEDCRKKLSKWIRQEDQR